ncbi:hypothetical protein [Acinetobacter towneri]|uniref:hypothetical protein n=1 Tax=Acinetobacter towneri TaxID=202956 RepID=UPI00321324E5
MIYFSMFSTLAMQKLQDEITRSNCVLFAELDMEFHDDEEFINFVEKWTERYQLTISPKERFKQKKKGHPTFDLIIKPNLVGDDAFTKDLIEIAKNEPEKFTRSDFDFLNHSESYLEMKFYLFCNIDTPQIYDGLIPIDQVNSTLKKYIDGAEKFSYVFDSPIKFGNYELVRLTQKRSIKDDLEGREKNASDWTWRIGSESYSKVQKQGEVLINRWNQCIEKSEEEKQAYFEKHLKILEGYLGFRGVRKQVGTLWAKERKVFKAKYGEKYLPYYRPLKLKYVQRLKSGLRANAEPLEMIEYMKKAIQSAVK